MRTFMTLALVLAVGVASVPNWAHAAGKGRTKIDFQFDTANTSTSRLFAKIDISAALSQLGNSGKPSHNDDLAGYTLTVTVGSASFSALMDSEGKSAQDDSSNPPVPFTAKLTANGKILQIMVNGANLKDLLGVDTTQKNGTFSIEIDVTASKTDNTVTPPVTTTIPLSTQSVSFKYSVKQTTVKGKNF